MAIRFACVIRGPRRSNGFGGSVNVSLEFKIAGWLPSDLPDIRERETLSSLRIVAGDQPITEVNDVLAHTVRDYIQVPAYQVARWLLLNWWRLRWEAAPAHLSFEWRKSHSMAAISS